MSKKFKDAIPEIEKDLGVKLKWKPAQKSDRIIIESQANLKDPDKWDEDYKWFIDNLIRLKKLFMK